MADPLAPLKKDLERIKSVLPPLPGVKKRKKLPLRKRGDVRVEVLEERDRLHIGIQDNKTGDYIASWWDDDARQMFEDGFFKSRRLKESVLDYAEEVGLLA